MTFPKPATVKGNRNIIIGLDQLIPTFGIGDRSLSSDPQKERIDEQNWGSVSKDEREMEVESWRGSVSKDEREMKFPLQSANAQDNGKQPAVICPKNVSY